MQDSHWSPRVDGEMQIVSRLSRFVCANLALQDYSEDQKSQRIVSSAINNAFGVHSDHVQDIAVS